MRSFSQKAFKKSKYTNYIPFSKSWKWTCVSFSKMFSNSNTPNTYPYSFPNKSNSRGLGVGISVRREIVGIWFWY